MRAAPIPRLHGYFTSKALPAEINAILTVDLVRLGHQIDTNATKPVLMVPDLRSHRNVR